MQVTCLPNQQGKRSPSWDSIGGSQILKCLHTSVVTDLEDKVHPGMALQTEYSWSWHLAPRDPLRPGCSWLMHFLILMLLLYYTIFPQWTAGLKILSSGVLWVFFSKQNLTTSISAVTFIIQIFFYLYTVKTVHLLYGFGICCLLLLSGLIFSSDCWFTLPSFLA